MAFRLPEIRRAFVGLVILVLAPTASSGTSVPEPPLEELVLDADHAVVGTIRLVDMVDGHGNPVDDSGAMTGPGEFNTIRLHVVVDSDGIIMTNSDSVPKEITIPLLTAWHYTLHGVKQHEGSRGVFLLTGERFERVYPRYFHQPLSQRQAIERIAERHAELRIERERRRKEEEAPKHPGPLPETLLRP